MVSDQVQRLLLIMARLRDPVFGCAWDREQTFATIAPYTIEEAYEVADAIERDNLTDLRDELGDLLLQVVFHSCIAEEVGAFNFQAVARSICDKMEARHPHIFGVGEHTHEDIPNWEALKEKERKSEGSDSAMDGVAATLPALLRAEKLQKRAAREGFDWFDLEGPAGKLREEMEELAAATSPDEIREEAGDLLFAATNLVRAYGIAPEAALRAANAKFERRYRAMEVLAEGQFPDLTPDQQGDLWDQVKSEEKSPGALRASKRP